MDAAIRLARERIGLPIVVPAVISWALLFGYQWAFFLHYHGGQHTVFSYLSGVVGDGLLLPFANVGAFLVMRELWPRVAWRRLPLYIALGFITAFACFLGQAGLRIVNWSMPAPYMWSAVGQFHFVVMWCELAYLYVALGVAINNWSVLRANALAWRSYWAAWFAIVLFGATLIGDVIRFSAM